MGKYNIHFSRSIENRSGTTNPALLELMADKWTFEIVESENEESAMEKLIEKYGKERINYVLSVTPV
jgi:hypothetical protein